MHKVYIKFEQAILYYGLLGCMGFISRVNWDSQPSVWDSKILVSWGIQLHLHDTTMKLWKNESVDAQPRLANSLVCLSPELCSERQASVESQKKTTTTNDQNWCSAEKPNKSAQIELWSPTLKISAIFTVPAVVTVMFWPVSSLVLSLWLYLVDSLVLSLRLSLVDSSVFRLADLSTLSCSLWVQWHQDVFSLLAPAAKTLSFRRIETPCLTSWFHVWFMSLFIQLRARQAGSCSHLSALS